jgi:DNA-directed RNA polymerase subunit beta'
MEIKRSESEEFGETFAQRVDGRVAAQTVKDGNKVLVKAGEEITKELSHEIEESKVESVIVRSVTFCKEKHGICQNCYGRDLATGKIVEMGVTAGVIAAQAIGEPGTQLTMKTFHLGGVSGEDITSGLPRVEELFEARRPKYEAPISEISGIVKVSKGREGNIIDIISDEDMMEEIIVPEGYELVVKNNDEVKAKKAVAVCKDRKAIRTTINGQVKVGKGKVTVVSRDKLSASYIVNPGLTLLIKSNDKVVKGQVLAEGHLNLSSVLRLRGKQEAIKYMIKEIKSIYMSQGQTINDKHLEVIIKQNLSKFRIVDEGDSEFVPGQVVDLTELERENEKLIKAKKKEAKAESIIMGITRVALKTESFLSAASFQETTGVLINAAIRGAVDELRGLKENVIIGKLIPAGTGIKSLKKEKK